MRRIAAFAAALVAVIAACYPIEQPPSGVASMSPGLAPWPAVVVNDTMRDSMGKVAPLNALAFGTRGDTLGTLKPAFVLLDSGAHLVGNLLVGDIARGPSPVRVVGSVGSLQTPPQNIYIVVAPTTLKSSTTTDSAGHTDTLKFVPTPDSTSANNQFALSLSVVGDSIGGTPVPGWLVNYAIDYAHAPVSSDTAPAVFMVNNQNHRTSTDTTTTSGTTAMHLQLVYARLKDTTLSLGHRSDSVIVVVSAKYKGAQLSGSPARFVIPLVFGGFSTK